MRRKIEIKLIRHWPLIPVGLMQMAFGGWAQYENFGGSHRASMAIGFCAVMTLLVGALNVWRPFRWRFERRRREDMLGAECAKIAAEIQARLQADLDQMFGVKPCNPSAEEDRERSPDVTIH